MKIDTMRRIDRLVGVPLCLLATGLLRVGRWLRRPAPRPIRRVLFIELSEMGSTILADPAMRQARDRLGAELHFAIFASNAASLDLLETVPAGHGFRIRAATVPHLAAGAVRLRPRARPPGRRKGLDRQAGPRAARPPA